MGGNHVSVPSPTQPTMSYMTTSTAQPPQPVSHASGTPQSPNLSRSMYQIILQYLFTS